MKKPDCKHVSAITRSIYLLESGLNEVIEQRFKKALERDMLLMAEVKDMLRMMIENPTLPFLEGAVEPIPPDPEVKAD